MCDFLNSDFIQLLNLQKKNTPFTFPLEKHHVEQIRLTVIKFYIKW